MDASFSQYLQSFNDQSYSDGIHVMDWREQVLT